ncbi:hypothetical protein [Mannheimia haemolytica]|uniref:hypothetical protein n=1 Tax=Mannheimia haemolytica TaxID=75985 RepID=UPI002EA53760|nr:hypothetical protein [Mannheimia haemolytica]
MDKSQGVVSVNIRGGSGFGRANNAIGPNYMGMLAGKYQFNDSTWIGALFGHSWRKISQNYKIGGGRKVTDSSIDLSKIDDLDKESSTTSPFNAAHLKQKSMSRMAKLEYGDKYQTITLSYRDYQSQVAGRHLKNQNNQLNYRFHLPESPWLDVQVAYAENQGKQNYNKGS